MRNKVTKGVLGGCLTLLSATVLSQTTRAQSGVAYDYRAGLQTYVQAVAWDEKAIQAQTQGSVYLRARIEKLEQENEQLRNSITQMRSSHAAQSAQVKENAYSGSKQSSQIQALLEENKRLLSLLDERNAYSPFDETTKNFYIQKLKVIEEENKILKSTLNQRPEPKTPDVSKLEQALAALKKEKGVLQKKNQEMSAALLSVEDQLQGKASASKQEQERLSALETVVSKLRMENEALSAEKEALNAKVATAEKAASDAALAAQKAQEVAKKTQEAQSAQPKPEAANVVVLQNKINDLKNRNLTLQADLNKGTKEGQVEIKNLKEAINKLTAENSVLKTRNTILSTASQEKKDSEIKVSELESTVQMLKDKNATLLASIENRKGDSAALKKQIKKADALAAELAALKKENQTLLDEKSVIQTSAANTEKLQADLEELKQQNASLRDTIQAQNAVLVSSDNAAQTAEQLITENKMLKNKLGLMEKKDSQNLQIAQEISSRVSILEKEVAQRDSYIKKLESIRLDMEREMRNQPKPQKSNDDNGALEMSALKQELAKMRAKQDKLKKDLEREQGAGLSYRIKIREYQKTIADLKGEHIGIQAYEDVDDKVAYQEKINDLEDRVQSSEKALTALKVENQDLKARIKLLSKKEKEASALSAQELLGTKPDPSSVEYIRGDQQVIEKTTIR